MSIEARTAPPWLTNPEWERVELAWRRRDNLPLRHLVASILDDGRDDLEAGGALLGWRRLSQAVFTGHSAPLEAYIESLGPAPVLVALRIDAEKGDPGDDSRIDPFEEPEVWEWAVRAAAVIDALFDAVGADALRRAHGEPTDIDDETSWAALAAIAVFAYFETLVFWEHSDSHEPMRGVLCALRDRVRRELESDHRPVTAVSEQARRVLRTVELLAASLPRQFDYEDGLGCSCPVTIGRAAGRAAELLRAAEAELGGVLPEPSGAAGRRIAGLIELLRGDVEHTVAYFDLLAADIAPAVLAFDVNLGDRASDASVSAELARVIERTEAFELTQQRRGVFATEARANRVTLEAMLDVVRRGRPSLRVNDGEIVFIYPFGLPLVANGRDIVDHLLHLHFRGAARAQVGSFRLAGCRVTIDDTPQTSNWNRIAADSDHAEDSQHLDVRGVRLLFEQDVLTVRTGAGVCHDGLGIEVRLGALGNHYVRISISTSTPYHVVGSPPVSTATADGPPGWSPHDIDQLVRLAGEDVGPVSVRFSDRDGVNSERRAEFSHLTELVGTVVTDLAVVAEQLEASGGIGDRRLQRLRDRQPGHNYEWRRQRNSEFVRRHAQVLLSVADASSVGPHTTRPVAGGEDLRRLFGASVLLSAQRSYSTSLDEWARFETYAEAADWLPDAYRGVRGEMISCSGDTTLVLAPTAPNWQVLEDRELVEFAASLTGAYSMQRLWLGRTVDRASLALRPSGDDLHPSETTPMAVRWWRWLHGRHRSEVKEDLERAQQLDKEVTSQLRAVESLLAHAQSALVSRNQRDRDVLEKLCASNGVDELHDALRATVVAAEAQQSLIRSRCSELEEDRRFQGERLAQSLLLTLGAFAFIDLFWWAGEVWGLGRKAWLAEVAFIAFVAALVLRFVADPWFERRRRRRARGAPTSPPR